jgi:maleylacetate reductase
LAVNAHELVPEEMFGGFTLLTTERHEDAAPGLVDAAARVLHVPEGRVDEISAELLDGAGEDPLVAAGGGRVIDTAKAIAGVTGAPCAALPTTLSGAEMTGFHRTPRGVDDARWVRPALVLADPDLMVSAPAPRLAATAMNALAHSMEALYAPLAAPVPELASLRAAELIGEQLPRDDPDRSELALAALLAGYASGASGIAGHHAICQTIVRVCGTPHAETNAVMLPHFARLMIGRAPGPLGQFAAALGDPAGDPAAAAGRIAKLAARCGHTRLSTLGVAEEQLAVVVRQVQSHPALGATPEAPDADELLALLEGAL